MATINSDIAAVKAMRAKGEALAIRFIKEQEAQVGKNRMFLNDIAALTQEGRVAFRVRIDAELEMVSKAIKESKGTAEEAIVRATANSMRARYSEVVQFSRAIDAGLSFNEKETTGTYHEIIGTARTLLRSAASMVDGVGVTQVGPTQRRGRPAKTKVEKAMAYLSGLDLSHDECFALIKHLQALDAGKIASIGERHDPKSGATLSKAKMTTQAEGLFEAQPRKAAKKANHLSLAGSQVGLPANDSQEKAAAADKPARKNKRETAEA